MSPRKPRLFAWLGPLVAVLALLALLAVLALYTRADFMLTLAGQIWACF